MLHFPLFSSHLELAHQTWHRLLSPGDTVVDATCGRGHDTLALSQLVLADGISGYVWGLDIQPSALAATHRRLAATLTPQQLARVTLHLGDHATPPPALLSHSLKLVVYNLGYLPGGDKTLVTTSENTLLSLHTFASHITPGGAISVMCYVGHPGGQTECDAILAWASTLPRHWNVCCHRWLNAENAPLWLLLQRAQSD